jgi:hypothetical protein
MLAVTACASVMLLQIPSPTRPLPPGTRLLPPDQAWTVQVEEQEHRPRLVASPPAFLLQTASLQAPSIVDNPLRVNIPHRKAIIHPRLQGLQATRANRTTPYVQPRRSSRNPAARTSKSPPPEVPLLSSFNTSLEWSTIQLPYFAAPLGQIQVENSYKIAFENVSDNHRVAHIRLGEWKLAFPRFIRLSHALWWQSYDIVKSRMKQPCTVTLHPQLTSINLASVATGNLKDAEKEVVKALGLDPVPTHDGWMEYCENGYAQGDVSLLTNAQLSQPDYKLHSCSQLSDINVLLNHKPKKASVPPVRVPAMFWAYVSAAPFFQHWTQNVLPKLAQAGLADASIYENMNNNEKKWTANQELLSSRFPIVEKMYEHMGWNPPVNIAETRIIADELIYACNSPPLHPTLWRLGQQRVLQVKPKSREERKTVVYCGRSKGGHTENEGRRVLNEAAVLRLLAEWAPSSFQVTEFDHGQYTSVEQLVDFWSDARALIGPHGGCLTNALFMPPNGVIIEGFPLFRGFQHTTLGSGHMMYVQAMLLEHEYWMLPAFSKMRKGDFHMDLLLLCEILVRALGAPEDGADCEVRIRR